MSSFRVQIRLYPPARCDPGAGSGIRAGSSISEEIGVRCQGFVCAMMVVEAAVSATAAQERAGSLMPYQDRVRLAEAMRVGSAVRERLWPGWERAPAPILLITDPTEFLVGHPRPGPDFLPLGRDSLLRHEVLARPRQFPPTMLATFPAVAGIPTVVIGSAESSGKSSVDWVLTVLHEDFHQWQFTRPGYYAGVARLDLARGDTTGQWMLHYPFPYDSAPVKQAARGLADALLGAIDAPRAARPEAVRTVRAARDALRGSLAAADWRYLEFQLWQEGVGRYIELAVAGEAAKLDPPSAAFRELADRQSYTAAAVRAGERLRRELEQFDLGSQRRETFYPLGAAIGLVLDQRGADWKRTYADRPFELAALLAAPP